MGKCFYCNNNTGIVVYDIRLEMHNLILRTIIILSVEELEEVRS
ncbi:11908_t:CDS:1, partial [Gigaspora rosea]